MKAKPGFILLSCLMIFLLCMSLFTAVALAFSHALKCLHREQLLVQALPLAQANEAYSAAPFTITTSQNPPFKETKVYYDAQLIFNLITYAP